MESERAVGGFLGTRELAMGPLVKPSPNVLRQKEMGLTSIKMILYKFSKRLSVNKLYKKIRFHNIGNISKLLYIYIYIYIYIYSLRT